MEGCPASQPGLTVLSPSQADFLSLCSKPTVYIYSLLCPFCWGSSSLSHLFCCNLWLGEEMHHRKSSSLAFIGPGSVGTNGGLEIRWDWASKDGRQARPKHQPPGRCLLPLCRSPAVFTFRDLENCVHQLSFHLTYKASFKSMKKLSHQVRVAPFRGFKLSAFSWTRKN